MIEDQEGAPKSMPLVEHLRELRRRLIIALVILLAGSVAAFALYEPIIRFMYRPLLGLDPGDDGNLLYINSLFEGFLVRIKIAVFTGGIVTFPFHLLNLAAFVFPGLKKQEKRVISLCLVISMMFILAGFFYSYRTIIPVSITFLTDSRFIPESTGLLLSFGDNIFYILQFMLLAMVVFQTPILLELLLMMNILTRKRLLHMGRYVIVFFFLLAAVLTPPDFVSQIAIAFPLTILYYLTILVAKVFKFGEG